MEGNLALSISDEFGFWFAGLSDGEGCFDIKPINGASGTTYICRFTISLRDDDLPILRECQETLGMGSILICPASVDPRGYRKNPTARWEVSRKPEVARLVRVFERFPLRAKKRYDLEVWAEAVRAWCAITTRTQRHDWSHLGDCADRLRLGRSYKGEVVELAPAEQPQLKLVV